MSPSLNRARCFAAFKRLLCSTSVLVFGRRIRRSRGKKSVIKIVYLKIFKVYTLISHAAFEIYGTGCPPQVPRRNIAHNLCFCAITSCRRRFYLLDVLIYIFFTSLFFFFLISCLREIKIFFNIIVETYYVLFIIEFNPKPLCLYIHTYVHTYKYTTNYRIRSGQIL